MLIHLQPELIEKVNKHIVTIIKMPETCYQAHKCLENSEAVMTLQKAAEAYNSSLYQLAVTHYKSAIVLLKSTSDYEGSPLISVIQYLICKCLIKTSQLASLIEAKDTLINLIETTDRLPMLYYLLSSLYIKTFCYKEADKLINYCLSILNSSTSITSFNIPTTNEVIPESTFEELSRLLVQLKDECSGWHRPDAICFMKNCNSTSLSNLLDRDIYFKSPAFNGLVVVTCNNNINPCVFNFHINCWKLKKEELSPNIKLSDKDFLNWKCFTPNCDNFDQSSIIRKIDIYNSDNTIKSHVALPEKIVKQQQTPKGAVRKQKINNHKITPKVTRPRNISNIISKSDNLSTNVKNKYKKIRNNEEMVLISHLIKLIQNNHEILISHLIKLIQVRNSNYGIEQGKDWRPDLSYYGDSSMIVSEDMYPEIIDIEDEGLKQKKDFLYSYFYEYVSCNAPVKKDTLMKKWVEAKTLISNCEFILYELKCPTVVEFLLKSMKFAMVGEYICTPATLPDAYKRVSDNVCGILKCLMKKGGDSDSDDDLVNEEFLKSLNSFDSSVGVDHTDDSTANGFKSQKIDDFKNQKINEINNMLSSDYASKKNVLLFNIRLARNEYLIIDKLQTVLIYSTGTMLPLSNAEWMMPIEKMEKLCFDLDNDYSKKLELLNDEEYCKAIESISCIGNVLPHLPKRDLTLLIQIAFNLYRDNLRRVDPSFNQAPGYPPGFNQTSLYENPLIYQQRPQFWNQISSPANFNSNYQQFLPRNNPVYPAWNSKLFGGNINNNNNNNNNISNNNINDQNNINGQWSLKATDNKIDLIDINSKKEFINYDEINSKGSLSDMKEKTHAFNYTELPESLNNDKVHQVLNYNCEEDLAKVLEDWKSIWEDKIDFKESEYSEFKVYKEEMGGDKKEVEEEMGGELKEEIGNKKSHSMDKLLRELRAKHRGVLEYDLLYCVEAVRKKYNGSLSGLTFAEIIGEVEKLLPGRERLQLRNYDRRIFSKKQVKKLEKVEGTKSANSQKVEKKSTSKSNPWATLDGYQWTNEDFGENECIICTEAIIKFGKVPSYTLRCKHTFHKKCIKNWFNQNQSCPICRIHCIIDDEFPPLS
ncbi:uncharacterized protein LOC123270839 [Cotesia glomerata]|uniref:uncharacterized protein LOC123270839 n=1 Tax=Cotesia glomerata TaxID=32391 RepID=UPI001D02D72B|nr:uncharacterized protein LOC123270839 [Cotesia glomerata]